ncbi:Riboflavin biosynthesis protein RibBA [Halomicronema hongdechloris C2206]|uniref:GTP cyclohydrolase II n=1 Tax=Halomicronema hongdechloris C2206 TaxID=1641165 RepID=A0A1Z3HT57_9CYAN|nr:GTP cyclohydrolase II [Halomicronema hongdechloris]ASC73511.1 Riboflavin biosynthesis protein RibBA [Halomicronema hongdechloris C2206]
MIELQAESIVPSYFGDYRMLVFLEKPGDLQHIAVVFGYPEKELVPLVRVHSACVTGEIFRASNCDCREQLDYAFSLFRKEGHGILVYLDQEGRGNGLPAKLKTMKLIQEGESVNKAFQRLGYPGDARHYGVAAEILEELGIHQSIELLTNNPKKINELEAAGIRVERRRSSYLKPKTELIRRELISKRDELDHYFPSAIEIEKNDE